ncbi:hypothetical protein [Flagellimonas meishanensis]|uniref:hypothetical protein n=1 Tax=Flagellimonas meishanensis TaxID=2873264 RepID=UPI001CA77966|nr:hypothetical protein [[Muricauda] meishanensis]
MKSLLFILVSLAIIVNNDSSPTNSNLEGLWINEDMDTRGITKCTIRYKDNRFHVQIWGKCNPTDCDWGENTSGETPDETDKLKLTWDNKFVERNQTFELVEGRLFITTENHYKDGRPKNSHSETLIKK